MIDWYDMFKLFIPIFITFLINLYIRYTSSCTEKNKILFSTLELFEKTLETDLFFLQSMKRKNLEITPFILQPLQIKFDTELCIRFFSYELELKNYLLQYLQMREYFIKKYANGINREQLDEITTYVNGLRVKVHLDKQSLRIQLKNEQSVLLILKRKSIKLLSNQKFYLLVLFLLLVALLFYKIYPMIP